MTPYVVSPLAKADLDAIWDYVAEHNPAAADRLLTTFHEKFLLLTRHPLLGQLRDELRPGFAASSWASTPSTTKWLTAGSGWSGSCTALGT